MTRTGKIARLPHSLRIELNRRLHDGGIGTDLIEWLNTLPEVKAVLHEHFSGNPINDQNLTEWKQGGYQDWLATEEVLAQASTLAENAGDLAAATRGHLL